MLFYWFQNTEQVFNLILPLKHQWKHSPFIIFYPLMFFQANKCINLMLLQAYLDYLWHKKQIVFAFLFRK